MNTKEEELLKRLQAIFQVEAEEHINVLSTGLIELEKNPKNKTSLKLIETIFREAHSLKGAARSVNNKDIESLCQVLESLFAKLKNKQIYFSADQFDLVHKSLDTLSKMISSTGSKSVKDDRELIRKLLSIAGEDQKNKKTKKQAAIFKKGSEETKQNAQPVNGVLIDKELVSEEKPSREIAQVALPAMGVSAPAESVDEKPLQLETVRIQTSKLDPLFMQAEQMIQSKIASVQRTVELKSICDFVGAWKTELRKLEARRSGEEVIHPSRRRA